MKQTIIIAALVLLVTIGVTVYFIISEKETNNFSSYQEAIESGIIQKGWIPSFIPQSSFNIKEHHRVDVPSIYVELEFKENDLSSFNNSCNLLQENTYKCENSGYPVKVTIRNKSHAIIQSI